MRKKLFQPTRSCPHRFCKPLHIAIGPPGLYFLSQFLFGGVRGDTIYLGNYVILFFLVAVVVVVIRLVHNGKTLTEIHTEEIASNKGYLMVRTGWARAAVALDAGVAAVLYAGMWDALASGSHALGAVSMAYALIPVAVGVLVIAILEYAHYKATRPAKPKRVPVTVASEA